MRMFRFFALALAMSVSSFAFGQGLNWSTPQSSANTAPAPGGVSGRPGIAGVYFNNQVWGAVTRTGSYPEVQMINNGGGTGTTFYSQSAVIVGGVYALSNVNPALTQMNGYLYLAYTDQNGLNYVVSSTDGVNWTGPSASTASGLPSATQYSPSITADPATGTIYIAYANGQYYTPVVCKWVPGSSASCTQYYSLDTENFNPGIVFWNGTVYLGYEHRGDSHCLYFYKYNPSTTGMTAWTPIGCDEQTSAGPSLAIHNNQLYVAFRTNDSSAKFTIRVSPDGNTLNFRQQPGFTMDGYPQLVEIPGTVSSLMNIYPRYSAVYATLGQ